MGKPRGKATDPLIHATGSVTLLLQLGRKAHVHSPLEPITDSPGETPEVRKIHESTQDESSASGPDKVLGIGIDGRGIPSGPLETHKGTGLSLGHQVGP